MKITIDTKEDSHDDIKKVLKMLEAWIEGQGASPMNMFGDVVSDSSESSPSTESSGDLFSLFDDDKAGDKKEETSEIIELDSDDKKDDDVPPVTTY